MERAGGSPVAAVAARTSMVMVADVQLQPPWEPQVRRQVVRAGSQDVETAVPVGRKALEPTSTAVRE